MATVLDNQRVRVNRISATRDDRVKRMEPSSSVSCPGHHRLVEPVLHETQVSRLLWSCGAIAVASLSTWQCDRCI